MSLFPLRRVEDYTTSIASYLPGGKLFISKHDSARNIRKLVAGLAEEAFRANRLMRQWNINYYPDKTTDLIEEWESALGIPDTCLKVDGISLADRQRNIIVKLAGMNVQTAEDFEALALAFGVSATVVGGKDPSVDPPILDDKEARFTIVVRFVPTAVFPYTFPIVFGNSSISILECLFEKIRPANCAVRFDSI